MNAGEADRRYVWHPFTAFDTWLDPACEPVVIVAGQGCRLIDAAGREYLDGNASIWVNLHGHNHARINQAIIAQLGRIAHSSFLGLTNDQAPELARRLIDFTQFSGDWRVFYSDDGSTAIEAAIKIVYQFFQQNGERQRTKFLSLGGGYHGDTVGAMSVGHSPTFHAVYGGLLFQGEETMAPGCYRCPYNRATPEKADARRYRKCAWECVRILEEKVKKCGETLAGFVVEPRVQGAAGFVMHPDGFSQQATAIVQAAGGKVIADEVMTGFGRVGARFASGKDGFVPDVLCLAKGLTGGYLPLAATILKEEIALGFRGGPERTFYHGHSYSGNQLGCAAALANLDLLEEVTAAERLGRNVADMAGLAERFWQNPHVGDVRQEGLILAIELVKDFTTRERFTPELRMGAQVGEAARRRGLLTRPVGDVVVLLPALNVSAEELSQMGAILAEAIDEVMGENRLNRAAGKSR